MSSNDENYLWDGEGDDASIRALEKRARELRLEAGTPRSGRRRVWAAPLACAVATALLAFHTLEPAQVPSRFIGLFADADDAASALGSENSVKIEYTLAGATEKTAAVVDVLRRRGATIDYWRDGSIIAGLDNVAEEQARELGHELIRVGRISFAVVAEPGDEVVDGRYVGEPVVNLLGPLEFSNVRVEDGTESSDKLVFSASVETEHAGNVARYLEEHSDRRIVVVQDAKLVTTTVVRRGPGQSVYLVMPDPTRGEIENLRQALEARVFPAGVDITLVNVSLVSTPSAAGAVWAARALLAFLLGLALFLLAWLLECLARPVDPDVSPLRDSTSRRGLAARWGVTAIIVAIPTLLLALPEHIPFIPASVGLLPFVAGIALAYMISRLPGPTRRLSRRSWRVIGYVAGIALLLFSARTLAVYSGGLSGFAILVVGGAVLIGVAELGSRYGAINGYVALLVVGLLPRFVVALGELEAAGFGSLFGYLCGGFVVVAITALALRRRVRVAGETRRLAVGWSALALLVFGMLAIDAITSVGMSTIVAQTPFVLLLAPLAVAIIAWHLWPRVASGPRVVGEKKLELGRRLFAAAIALGYVGLLSAMPAVGYAEIYDGAFLLAPGSLVLAFLTAVALDIIAQARASWRNPRLTRVAELDDVRDAGAVADALARAGIDAHLGGQYVRHLTGPLGAFAPIEVMVPAHRADEAQTVVLGQL